MPKPTLTIGIPIYNGQQWLRPLFKSIFNQSWQNFRIVVCDDNSTDSGTAIIKNFSDPRIKIFQHSQNVGYAKNLQRLKNYVDSDILFLLGQDDILLEDALEKTYRIMTTRPQVNVVTRPYYWFEDNKSQKIRHITPYNGKRDEILPLDYSKEFFAKVIESIGQFSGLAYRTKAMQENFYPETFTAHIYPFLDCAKKGQVAFLKDNTVAIRTFSSQTRSKSSIYNTSPTGSWVKMFKQVFSAPDYKQLRKWGIDIITTQNFIGLAQIKNYSTHRNLIKEIVNLIKFHPLNIFNLRFWIFSIGALLIPKKLLSWIVDNYKRHVLSRIIK